MRPTGITDEAGPDITTQIAAAKALGWTAIELRAVRAPGSSTDGSIHEIPEAEFDAVAGALDAAGIGIAGIGSTIANWARSIDEPMDVTRAQLDRLIPRAHRLGATMVRIMSYAVRSTGPGQPDDPDQMPAERIARLREITARLTDAGLTPAHENCMNYGGMAVSKTLELLDAVPGLKLVFDTANPVFNRDRDQPGHVMQDPWAFYTAVRDHVVHVHIKDCIHDVASGTTTYTWPGEGHACVREILADLKARGYHGWISIEPHMAVVFHDPDAKTDDEAARAARFENFTEYGRRLGHLLATCTPTP